MSHEVLFLTGSPAPTSKSAAVARALAAEVERAGFKTVHWSPSDFDPADIWLGRAGAPGVARFVDAARRASAVVFATPVYKATYSGVLKAAVDLVPPDALTGRPALGVATARLAGHGVEVDRAFQSLFAFFKARPFDTLVVLDEELQAGGAKEGALPEGVQARVERVARGLVAAVGEGRGP